LRGGLGADAKLGAAGEDRQAQLLEDLLLDRGSPLLGGKDARLVLGEGGGDESLRAHGGRLALVIGRDQVQVRLGHLDIETKDLVVSNLERLDSGARPLRRLHRGDGGAAALGKLGELVQLGAESRPHEPGIAPRRNFIEQRPVEERSQIGQLPQRRRERFEQRRAALFESSRETRHLLE